MTSGSASISATKSRSSGTSSRKLKRAVSSMTFIRRRNVAEVDEVGLWRESARCRVALCDFGLQLWPGRNPASREEEGPPDLGEPSRDETIGGLEDAHPVLGDPLGGRGASERHRDEVVVVGEIEGARRERAGGGGSYAGRWGDRDADGGRGSGRPHLAGESRGSPHAEAAGPAVGHQLERGPGRIAGVLRIGDVDLASDVARGARPEEQRAAADGVVAGVEFVDVRAAGDGGPGLRPGGRGEDEGESGGKDELTEHEGTSFGRRARGGIGSRHCSSATRKVPCIADAQ